MKFECKSSFNNDDICIKYINNQFKYIKNNE